MSIFKRVLGQKKDKVVDEITDSVITPFPLSSLFKSITGFGNTIKEAINDIRKYRKWNKMIRLVIMVVVGGLIWYLIAKGLYTIEEIKELMDKIIRIVESIIDVVN